eukprot:scaffold16606_cov84-Isochrysis_galbana.AAC.1
MCQDAFRPGWYTARAGGWRPATHPHILAHLAHPAHAARREQWGSGAPRRRHRCDCGPRRRQGRGAAAPPPSAVPTVQAA